MLKKKKLEGPSVVIKKSKKDLPSAGPSAGQTMITNFIKMSPVMQLCGRIVVEDGRPFSNFDSEPMQELITLGKKGSSDFTKKAINGGSVRALVQEEAEAKRKEIIRSLKGKVVHLSSDMATVEARSFFGIF